MHLIYKKRLLNNCKSTRYAGLGVLEFCFLFFVFLFFSYFSVSSDWPNSVPVHHDDYTNYSLAGKPFEWGLVRPLSTCLIYILSMAGPDFLIWSVRLLTVLYVYLVWQLVVYLGGLKNRNFMFIFFSAAVFSTPIIVEYAHYTGMITHLLSGCLAMLATLTLLRGVETNRFRWMIASAGLIVLSALAKEDFLAFYGLSVIAFVLQTPRVLSKVLAITGIGLLSSVVIVAVSKLAGASSFLGETSQSSSYYINISPLSIGNTMFRYLSGETHPAMLSHGYFVVCLFFIVAVFGVSCCVWRRKFFWSGYFLLSTCMLILPYALLPNHVNSYYEMIWWPILVGAFLIAFNGNRDCVSILMKYQKTPATIIMFLGFVILLLVLVDYSGRKSVSAWYDAVSAKNEKLLLYLSENSERIRSADQVCISGADSFSPWFMHGGSYLSYVMNLRETWLVVSDKEAPEFSGLMMGAAISSGKIQVIGSGDAENEACLHFDIRNI